jgi:putative ABC transport system permease protein
MLWKKPGFTLIVALTLSLGIGANTAIFSVVNAALLAPLSHPQPERLVVRQGSPWVPAAVFDEWRAAAQTGGACDAVAAYVGRDFNLAARAAAAAGEPEYVEGAEVSSDFFPLLAVGPALGRGFAAEDFQHGRSALISHELWQRRFGASAGVIGAAVALDGEAYTVVGVLPAGFRHFPLNVNRPEVWTPLRIAPQRADGESNYVMAVARLRPGATLERARAEVEALATRLRQQTPRAADEPYWRVTLGLLRDELSREYRPALLLVNVAVALVLLIACVNVAGLLLARGAARRGELAVRAALGATRFRLARQLLTESLLLALAGGAAGLLLAAWCLGALKAALPAGLQRLGEVRLDGAALLFALLVSLGAGVLAGLIPALTGSAAGASYAPKEAGRGAGGGCERRLLRVFVVSEMALALVLMIGAALVVGSFARLTQVEPGFDARGVVTARVRLPEQRYATMAEIERFYAGAIERLAAAPGVGAVAVANNLPLSRANATRQVTVEGQTQALPVDFGVVSADYFRVLAVPVVSGRAFAATDTRAAPGVVIVDESFARAAWPNEDALGRRLKIGDVSSTNSWLTVVGVARDTKGGGLGAATRRGVYVPFTQRADSLSERRVGRQMRLLVRAGGVEGVSGGGVEALAATLREHIAALDAQQAVTDVRTLAEVTAASVEGPRFRAWLLGLFALLALALAAAGLYGVMSYAVERRTREIGVRVALGAQGSDVLRLVIGEGLRLTLVGSALGVAASLALTRLMAGLLFGVSATDPLVFAGVTLTLAGVALAACWIPARRAAKVDPMIALRCE